MRLEEYISVVTEQIRCKKAREMVGEELKGHILDQAEAFEAEGMFEDEALEKAVREMGDPVETGVSLDRVHRPQMSWSVLVLIAVISLMGIAVHAVLMRCNEQVPSIEYGAYFRYYITYTIYGFALMLLVYRLDYSILSGHASLAAAGFLAFVLIGSRYGVTINGATWWISVGPLYISLRMLMLLYVPLYGGLLYHYRGEGYKALGKMFLWSVVPIWVALRLPSLNVAAVLACSFLLLFSIAAWKDWYQINKIRDLAILWGGMLALPVLIWKVFAAKGFAGYQVERVQAFLSGNPEYNFYGTMVNKFLGSSRLLGGSWENIMELVEQLPEYHTDYILVSLIAVYGILAGILAVVLILFLIMKIFRISLRQKNQLGMIIGCGCGIVFLLQVILCVAVNLNLCPPTSATFPFFSYGGSGMMVFYILLGLVLSVYRHKNILAEKPGRKTVKVAS